MPISEKLRSRVGQLLGREPRGLREVPVRHPDGEPVVIRVASLVDGKPFPTLFWLVDPTINYRIDQEEASGLIKRLQQRVDDDPELQAEMVADHRGYVALRDSYLDDDERAFLATSGLAPALAERGIGGIADFGRIRCLHTWYAAHLVVPNTIGRLLEAHWAEAGADGGSDGARVADSGSH